MAQKILGNLPKGLIFIISAPAGTGKTTLVNMLEAEFSCVVKSISCTTRQPRPGEVNDVDYHFLTVEQFEAKVRKGDFLEHALVFGNHYGTCREDVIKEQEKGKHVILVIDTQGAMQLRANVPATFVFIKPPSMQALRERLAKRKTESMEVMERRLSVAINEMAMSEHYDYCIINDDLQTAYDVLRSVLIAEERRVVCRDVSEMEKKW